MKDNKTDKALALLAQLSYIDDEHIAFADSYFVKKHKSYMPIIASISVAAAVFLTVTVMLNAVLSGMFGSSGQTRPDALTDIQSVLYSSESEHSAYVQTFTPCIVWRDEGQTEYNIITVEQDDIKRLTSFISFGTPTEAETDVKTEIWLCPGNGTVVSPYLKPSAGNTGIEIFEYEPELIPSHSFTEELRQIINERNEK